MPTAAKRTIDCQVVTEGGIFCRNQVVKRSPDAMTSPREAGFGAWYTLRHSERGGLYFLSTGLTKIHTCPIKAA